MDNTRRSTHIAYQRTQENQACHMALSQGNMQRGRPVEAHNLHLKPLSQMMVASNNTPHGTTIDYRVVTDNTNKKIIQRLEIGAQNTCSRSEKIAILNALSHIKTDEVVKDDALSPCLSVIANIKSLTKKLNCTNKEVASFIEYEIGPYYSKSLDSALNYLEDKFEAGCSFEYKKVLSKIMEYFRFHPCDLFLVAHRKQLMVLYKIAVDTELNYIKYINNDPILEITADVLKSISSLCSRHSSAFRSQFITLEDTQEFEKYRETLKSITSEEFNDQPESAITEQLNYLDSKNPSGHPINNNNKRIYATLLRAKLHIILKDNPPCQNIHVPTTVCFLMNLTNMCNTYYQIINESPGMAEDIATVMQSIALNILLAIDEGNVGGDKEALLHYISVMGKQGHLDEELERLYVKCRQPKSDMLLGQFTDFQYKKCIDTIHETLHSDTPDSLSMAASMLKKLLNEKSDEITTMATKKAILRNIDILKRKLYSKLFSPILNSYLKCKRKYMNDLEMSQVLSIHKKQFIESNPYTFILFKISAKQNWMMIGSLVFYSDIYELSKKTKIDEQDARELLLIKHIIPDVSNQFVRKYLEEALMKCLQSIINDVGLISIEIANEISSWIDMLSIQYAIVNHSLISLNDEWKLANRTQAPHCPPLAQSSSGNQTSIPSIPMMQHRLEQNFVQSLSQPPTTLQHHSFKPTMIHTECRAENPLHSGIQETVTRSFESPTELSQLQAVEYGTTRIPTKNMWHQLHPECPPHFPPPYQSTPSEQASFMSTAGCSMQGAMPQQYSPMNSTEFKMNNPTLDEGLQQLLKASDLYNTQKDKDPHGSVPKDTLLTEDPSSDYYLLLENGMNLLTNWITQLEGQTIPRDEIYESLMGITNQDGHQIIFNLFGRMMKAIDDSNTKSEVVYLRNYLFSIRVRMNLSK